MNSGKRLILALAAITGIIPFTFGQKTLHVKEDLSSGWMVFDEGTYRPFSAPDDAGAKAVYMLAEAGQYHGQYLRISGRLEPAVFVNGRLLGKCSAKDNDFSFDSLRIFAGSSTLLIGIYQKAINPANLRTQVMTMQAAGDPSGMINSRPATYFGDFVITGVLILLILLIIIMRLNFKLTSDYFSVIRIFTGQESEDAQLYMRIGSGSTILFYAFCSLIVSFYLVVIFHFVPERYVIAWLFRAASFPEAYLQWIKLSAILFAAFMLKISLIYTMARLFGLSDIFGLHAFNWLRLMLGTCGAMTAVLVIYNVSRGLDENVYSGLFLAFAWVLAIWVIILFPKVVRRSNFSLFHIFSYLCATEIIPFLISIKLLYN